LEALLKRLPELRKEGFTHLCILDTESRHEGTRANLLAQLLRAGGRPLAKTASAGEFFWGPAEEARMYCEKHFLPLFRSAHVCLYSIVSPGAS
jgi:hypothetical protein